MVKSERRYMVVTNGEVAARLGLSMSTVSRMRTGKRTGSPATLMKISSEYSIPLDEVMSAAAAVHDGNTEPWIESIMSRILADGPLTAAG